MLNLVALGLFVAYSWMNLRPELAPIAPAHLRMITVVILFAIVMPTGASIALLWPVLTWLRCDPTCAADVPNSVALRAANAPMMLGTASFLGWIFVTAFAAFQFVSASQELPISLGVHLIVRPVLTGLIAATATFFAADYLCRKYYWPKLLAGIRIAGNLGLWRVRVWHRLFALWLAISFLPLGVVVLTTLARVRGLDLTADPLLGRVVSVVVLIAVSAALGGAGLAWLVSRSLARPLESLEAVMAQFRDGQFDARQPVDSIDEIGALAEGFNLMADRLSQSHRELAARNRELADALERVVFLEQVKRGLDRFVPETVRRAIEEHPDAPPLRKEAKDVTVLFLDIEGYTRLSETLPRPALNAVVEKYFSLFLDPIRAGGGDINETSGDGLMIIFQAHDPVEHAASAVHAALSIREQTKLTNLRAAPTHPAITVNIGVSSGVCDVGATRFTDPTGERWTFTASGPVTNLAARLGDYAAGGQILLARETAGRVQGRFQLRTIGGIRLKNFPDPVEAWEVLATSLGGDRIEANAMIAGHD